MSEPTPSGHRVRGAEIMLQNLPVGARLTLRNGSEMEVVENPRDGQWLFVRPVGSEQEAEMVFASDIVEAWEP